MADVVWLDPGESPPEHEYSALVARKPSGAFSAEGSVVYSTRWRSSLYPCFSSRPFYYPSGERAPMQALRDPARVEVLAPNFKRRLSGVTSTIVRLVPIQAERIAIAAVGPALPDHIPQIRLRDLIAMSRLGPAGPRVWHARRNTEMLSGILLRDVFRKRLKLLFTSASQRHHTRYTKVLIRQMDGLVATSRKSAGYLDRSATVILHGIDCELFRPPEDQQSLKAQMGLPPGPLVGCYGRIRAQKGTDVFVEAITAVVRDRPEVGAVVLGRATGKHRGFGRDLRARVAAAGLSDRVLFPPEVPVWEMPRWYQALDLFVAPQRSEGFGLTPLEAMACGVPVVATRVGAFDELVVEGETGHLIPPGDPAAMVAAVAGLLDAPASRARMAQAARAHVLARFRIEDEAEALNAVYRRLLSEESQG